MIITIEQVHTTVFVVEPTHGVNIIFALKEGRTTTGIGDWIGIAGLAVAVPTAIVAREGGN